MFLLNSEQLYILINPVVVLVLDFRPTDISRHYLMYYRGRVYVSYVNSGIVAKSNDQNHSKLTTYLVRCICNIEQILSDLTRLLSLVVQNVLLAMSGMTFFDNPNRWSHFSGPIRVFMNWLAKISIEMLSVWIHVLYIFTMYIKFCPNRSVYSLGQITRLVCWLFLGWQSYFWHSESLVSFE